MLHVAATINVLAPDFDVETIHPRRVYVQRWPFRHGSIARSILGFMRTAKGPVTNREICAGLLRHKNSAEPTAREINAIYASVRMSLTNAKGKSVERFGNEVPMRWRLKE